MTAISALIPTRDWIHTYIAQPYLEGGERLRRGVHGINFHLISQPRISLRERIVCILIGVLLLIPLINTIIWIAMQVFSEPEILSYPLMPRQVEPSELQALPIPHRMKLRTHPASSQPLIGRSEGRKNSQNLTAHPISWKTDPKMQSLQSQKSSTGSLSSPQLPSIVPGKTKPTTQPLQTQKFEPTGRSAKAAAIESPKNPFPLAPLKYADHKNNSSNIIASDWVFTQKDADTVVAETTSSVTHTTAEYCNGQLQKYHYASKIGEGNLLLTREGRSLHVAAHKNNEVINDVFDLKEYLWIQQSTLGFRDFILSKNTKLDFYGVHPSEIKLTKLTAEKCGIEKLEGFGDVQHVKIKLHHFPVVNAWFSLKSGFLIKCIEKHGVFARVTTELQIDPKPGSAHL